MLMTRTCFYTSNFKRLNYAVSAHNARVDVHKGGWGVKVRHARITMYSNYQPCFLFWVTLLGGGGWGGGGG